MDPIIIIGTGLAGYMLAKEFRKLDKETPLLIFTASDGRFYSKPTLSTALTASQKPEALAVSDVESMKAQLNADIKTASRVTHIDTSHQFILVGEERYAYSRLVLACGAEPIRPPLVGNAVQDILSVNDLEDYTRFREIIEGKKHIAVLGAGLVGCEFANDLVNAGHRVDVIAPCLYPIDRLLPEMIGQIVEKSLAKNGVVWHLGQLVSSIDKSDKHYRLTLSEHKILLVDTVLSAIGLRPNVDLAMKAGIDVNRGILVNQLLQTSAKNVYALGDCAEVNGLVLFFVAPLLQCARALAQTLAGKESQVTYPAMPITLKTPACPVVVSPPPQNVTGRWELTGEDIHVRALFYDEKNQLQGFALTGSIVKEKIALMKQLPPVLI